MLSKFTLYLLGLVATALSSPLALNTTKIWHNTTHHLEIRGQATMVHCDAYGPDTLSLSDRTCVINDLDAAKGNGWKGGDIAAGRHIWFMRWAWEPPNEAYDHCAHNCLVHAASNGFESAVCRLKTGTGILYTHRAVVGYSGTNKDRCNDYYPACQTENRPSSRIVSQDICPFGATFGGACPDTIANPWGWNFRTWALMKPSGDLPSADEVWSMDRNYDPPQFVNRQGKGDWRWAWAVEFWDDLFERPQCQK